MYYLFAGSGIEADRKANAKTTEKYSKNLVMYLLKLDASKALYPYKLKMMQNYTRKEPRGM